MRNGRRVEPSRQLAAARDYASEQLARLPAPLQRLEPFAYPVAIDASLRRLADEIDRIESQGGSTIT